MPRIERLAAVSIYIYADDHAPPHFHVKGPDTDCQGDEARLTRFLA
jgi:hypothetical protein